MCFGECSTWMSNLPGNTCIAHHLLKKSQQLKYFFVFFLLSDKPPIEDLQYFLDFQIANGWAPEQNNLQRKEPVCQSLQFSLMGPKLYISPDQHLVSLPKVLQPHWDAYVAIGAPKWQGPEEQDSRWFEPIKWKNFSHVSTAPIEYADTSIGDLSGVHIVTGA
ncbi:MACPF DOMAIN-CONTAINING PROTEIN CAD1 [Salix purpurea]|uniref:MACPF DOMAIN-CONTAINING PROTEIN CAD1 n=1 Tax=Salix purpurea TaxID=77065 RepID=A0A9Q0ZRV2_SALPP|nr:MACPF DOMAIN-CONTAINING PROTEIN CAD1 [Salix purpurea]